MVIPQMTPNHALERTAASALRLLAVPSSLRSSAAAQRERWAPAGGRFGSHRVNRASDWEGSDGE